MPNHNRGGEVPSSEDLQKFASLDLPARYDEYEKDPVEHPKIDFDQLLDEWDAVEKRAAAVEVMDPEKENREFDDLDRVMSRIQSEALLEVEGTYVDWDKHSPEAIANVDKWYNELLTQIKEKILKECGTLGNLASLQRAFELLASKEESAKMYARASTPYQPEQSVAAYAPSEGKIIFNPSTKFQMSNREIVESLASSGYAETPSILHHEKIHSDQFPPPTELAKKVKKILWHGVNAAVLGLAMKEWGVVSTLAVAFCLNKMLMLSSPAIRAGIKRMPGVKSQTILVETHAYRGADRFTGRFEQEGPADRSSIDERNKFSSPTDFLKHIEKYQVVKNKTDVDRFLVADDEIRRLYALGLSDEEIAVLTKNAKWNRKELRFDSLDEKISKRMEEKGLSQEDVDDLVQAEDIKQAIYWRKVRAISREQIRKFFIEKRELSEARENIKKASQGSN